MSQTLKFGNKTWATKEGSTLAYNDENGNYKPLPFNFTRSTSATRVNKEGLIEVVTNDRPRIDYTDTSDGVLLLEKAATNLIAFSEAFDNSYWTKLGASATSGFTSPDGTANAFKLVEDNSNGLHTFYQNASFALPTGNNTLSVFVKPNGRNFFQIRTGSGGGIDNAPLYANFDLINNIETTSSTGVLNSKVELYANNWKKISITFNVSSSNSVALVFQTILSGLSAISETYQGDGTSGVYIFGAMLEQNSVASSYIPTQGSATTRVAETASGAGNSEVFNDSEGVLFADIAANANDGTYRVFGLSDGTTNNRIILYYNPTSNNIELFISSGGAAQATLNLTLTDIKLFQKVAVKYKVNDIGLWINGFEVGTDSSATMPTGLNELAFDNSTGVQNFYGKTKEIGYYDTILTDLELETLTSYKSWTSMVNELNLNIIYNG